MNDLRLNGIVKSFGATTVLQGISLTFVPGKVTAIVGDNGAGKSTLCKTIAGVYRPDAGEIFLGDKRLDRLSPHDTRALGVEMIYQDLALAKQHDIVSNLFLGRERAVTRLGWLDKKAMRESAVEVLKQVGISLTSLDKPVGLLSGGQQQAVAIARALLFEPKVLIMDEPTAALGVAEIQHILEIVLAFKERGLIIILISHRLNDVFAVSDRIVTLHTGLVAGDNVTKETSIQQIIAQIVGAGPGQ
jgi:ABC-type sugar transport system ATPase subunit